MKPSRSLFEDIRGLRHHIRVWGDPAYPLLFLLHGWMDASASFQFLVDALARRWQVIAPDWRGYGLSAWQPGGYWFPDYVADLEAILTRFSPDAPATLVGHSMGGNIACLYAGVRPQRVARLVNLEGLGLPPGKPADAPGRLARWLDQLADPPRLRAYAGFDELAVRLIESNPRLAPEKAAFLARHCGRQTASGEVYFAADPFHKVVNPYLYRIDEAMAFWRAITAPVLLTVAAESPIYRRVAAHADLYAAFKACFARLEEVIIEDAGHMLQHDQPGRVAAVIEEFLARHPG